MTQRIIRLHVGLIVGALAATLGACKKGEYASNDTSAMKADSAAGHIDTSASAVTSPDSGTPAGRWADASVMGFATVANRGEIALGKLGEQMATDPAVRSFAHMLVTDHQKLLASTKQMTSKLATTADTAAGDARDLMNHDADEIRTLTGQPKGIDWDRAFIGEAIEGHEKVLSGFQDAAKNSPSASIRSSLEQASGVVQEHLTKAQDIKTNVLKH